MVVIPTRVVEHGHIPMPWAVDHCVFGLFVLKGGKINLYPEASSSPPWSATLLRNPLLVWMLWTLFTLSIQTVSSCRGWASWRFHKNPWASLPPMPSSTLAAPLWLDALLISSTAHIIILFWLPIGGSLQALHPLLNIIGCSWSLGCLAFPCGCPGLLAFIFFSTTALMVAWQPSCTVFLKASIWLGLPAN